jgi:peptide/nickel transport system ATP-binding protein
LIRDNVLEIVGLSASISDGRGRSDIVNEVDLVVNRGETVAIVGESGSGKSMTVLAATGLAPPNVSVSGTVRLLKDDLAELSPKQLRVRRARHIGFVYQNPSSSLDPLMTVGRQVSESYRMIYGKSRVEGRERAAELLRQVGIARAEERIDNYPHQFSGGMQQRVMIAMALACEPELLIADEATTALDVTTQAQVLDLIDSLQSRLGTAIILITHDLGIAVRADTIAVMYAGRIVELAPVSVLFARPAHPYTRALLAARPHLGETHVRLAAIPGAPPSPLALPPGCAFYPRCSIRGDVRCGTELPPLTEIGPGHYVRAFYFEGTR